MDSHDFVEIILGLLTFFGGWVMKNLQDNMKHLQETDDELTRKVQSIELLVAGAYVKRDELNNMTEALFKKLDRIEDKLNNKVDRTDCDVMLRHSQ